jgi:XTP/dITP diphosphohydrolase
MQLPRKILVATNNSGKFVEISDLLRQINIEVIKAPADLAEPAETGVDFAANSLLKAKYYAEKTGFIALADDSGLCIEALNGAPGIYSARFALDESGQKNFPQAFEKISASLKEKDVEPCGSKAHFICNLTIFDPQTRLSVSFEGRIDGTLTFPARGLQGFGYDPIFLKNGMAKTFGEISAAEKDVISHRAEAFRQLIDYFSSTR